MNSSLKTLLLIQFSIFFLNTALLGMQREVPMLKELAAKVVWNNESEKHEHYAGAFVETTQNIGTLPLPSELKTYTIQQDFMDWHGLYSGLLIAAQIGLTDVIAELISQGSPVNFKNDLTGNSALHEAAAQGHLECVKLLLAHGAQVNITNADLETPIMKAAICGHSAIVKELLDHGAQITQDIRGKNAMLYALQNGHHAVFDLIDNYSPPQQ